MYVINIGYFRCFMAALQEPQRTYDMVVEKSAESKAESRNGSVPGKSETSCGF